MLSPRLIFSVSLLVFWGFALPDATAQPPRNPALNAMIRPEYYAGLEFLADGKTTQAATAFDNALSQSRVRNGQKSIDSIPPLVMLGECAFEQMDIGSALMQYDAALQIAMQLRQWPGLLKNVQSSIRPDNRVRDVQWGHNARGSQMGAYPEFWTMVFAGNDSLNELITAGQHNGKSMNVDAMEILLCEAIAIRRRNLFLGPLAPLSPLSSPLAESLKMVPKDLPEPIRCAWNICYALAELGRGERATPIRILKQNLSLANGLDHPLTSIALLALADCSIEINELIEAEERSLEASLASARSGQLHLLAESVEYLCETGFADGHDVAVGKILSQIVNWANAHSKLVLIRAQVEWTRLAALMGDLEMYRKNQLIATKMLLPKTIELPRAEAVMRYAAAKVLLLEGKQSDGRIALQEAMSYLRKPNGIIAEPRLFQLHLAESLIEKNAFPPDVARSLLEKLVSPSSTGAWRVHPLEQVTWLLADKSWGADFLEKVKGDSKSAAESIARIDKEFVESWRRKDELESRVADLRLAMYEDRSLSSEKTKSVRSQLPGLDQTSQRLLDLIKQQKQFAKLETRAWAEEDSRRWDNIVKLIEVQEAMLWSAAIGPIDVPALFPPPYSPELLKNSLTPKDAVLVFHLSEKAIECFLLADDEWTTWSVNAAVVESQTMEARQMLSTVKPDSTDSLSAKSIWSSGTLQRLRKELFPDRIWTKLRTFNRWIVVPDQFLWYLPLSVLPAHDLPTSLPVIANHRIVYSPSLGLVPNLIAKKNFEQGLTVDLHGTEFFTTSPLRLKEIQSELSVGPRHLQADLVTKPNAYVPSRYVVITADELNSYTRQSWKTLSPVPTDANPVQSQVQQWLGLPRLPERIALPGLSAILSNQQGDSLDIAKLTVPWIAQGTRRILVSNWPMGGESSASLLRAFHENRSRMTDSEAWQRSVLGIWEEQFQAKTEPLVNGISSDEMVSGAHPFFWSGTILIGDQ